MAAVADLSEEERYLLAILQDQSGIDIAEFCWEDRTAPDNIFRCYDYQYAWYRHEDKFQVDQCVAEGSLVLTERGNVPIEDVRVGDRVLTHEGRWRRVTQVWDKGEQDVVQVAGNGNWRGLTVTPDHRLLTRLLRRKTALDAPEWTEAAQVATRPDRHHKWATPSTIEPLPLPAICERYAPGRANDLTPSHFDQDEFWWLVGLFVAKGSTSSSFGKSGKRNRVTLSVHEDEVAKVTDALAAIGFAYNLSPVRGERCTNIVINSLTLATFLTELCGTGARTKRLHPALLAHPRRAQVLDGAAFGDGYLREGRIEYSTTSHALAVDMRLLASSLGYASSMGEHKARDSKINGRLIRGGICYRVGIVVEPRRRTRAVFDGAHVWYSMVRAEEAGSARCYDLEVEEDHSFVAEGVVVHNCARAVGKSLGIQMRAFAFPFTHAGQEMLVTAPELIHLDPVTKYIEERITNCRLGREYLKTSGKATGFTHRPFEVTFRNGATIKGRIPQKDGKGVKGMHPLKLEMDEAQDYPEPGWVELGETLKFGDAHATWRAHGVSRGERDRYYKQTQKDSGWFVHRITAMHRSDWTKEEREAKAELYGSRDHPDYRRNILGLHGDATSSLFVLHRLMSCVDTDENSDYNQSLYYSARISDEMLMERGLPIEELLIFPASHKAYDRVWVGMDVGLTNHPSEIVISGEESPTPTRFKDDEGELRPSTKLKMLARIHLERISAPNQRRVLEHVYEFYKPKAIAMDRTGLGLPIYQEIQEMGNRGFIATMRAYNFSEKITVGYDSSDADDDNPGGTPVMANVLEYASDMLRLYVDQKMVRLPYDGQLIREFQGVTYTIGRSNTDAYGKRHFYKGTAHALDAWRMLVVAHAQEKVEMSKAVLADFEPIMDVFMAPIW